MIKYISILLCCISANATMYDLPDNLEPVPGTLPWLPGIQGGIPFLPTGAFASTYGAIPNDGLDDYSAITNAIANTPTGMALEFASGEYNLSKQIQVLRSSMVIRGAGQLATTIKPTAGTGLATILFGNGGANSANSVTNGLSRGSTNLVFATTNGITVGSLALIRESNDPTFIFGPTVNMTQAKGQVFYIVAMNGSTGTISRPLYQTYTTNFSPELLTFSAPQTNSGIEDLTMDMVNLNNPSTTTPDGVWFYRSANCWAYRVTITNTPLVSMSSQFSYRTEIRECVAGYNQVQNSSRYAYQLANNATDCLVEDCIAELTSSGYIIQNGASGNVIGYCFFGRGYTDFANCLAASMNLHGNAPNLNLFEGLKVQKFETDDVRGVNRQNTIFRCWATDFNYGTNYPTDCRNGYTEEFLQHSNAWIGSISMMPVDSGGATNGSYSPWSFETSTNGLTFQGMFSFHNGVTTWTGGVTNELPASYYKASKPSFFGRLAWPPIGPDVNVTSTLDDFPVIPAEARYLGIDIRYPASSGRIKGINLKAR